MHPVALLAASSLLAACTAPDLYTVGQGWQKEQCHRLADPAERERCLRSSARSYEDYKAEAGRAKSR